MEKLEKPMQCFSGRKFLDLLKSLPYKNGKAQNRPVLPGCPVFVQFKSCSERFVYHSNKLFNKKTLQLTEKVMILQLAFFIEICFLLTSDLAQSSSINLTAHDMSVQPCSFE